MQQVPASSNRSRPGLLALLLFLISCVPAGAQVEMDLRLSSGSAGQVPGRWAELQIELTGDVEEHDLIVRARSASEPLRGLHFEAEFPLGLREKRRLSWPVLLDPHYYGTYNLAEAREKKGSRLVASWPPRESPAFSSYPFLNEAIAPLVGVFGNAEGLDKIAAQPGLAISILDSNLAPSSPLGYDPFAIVVIADPDNCTFTPRDWSVLRTWVEAGGVLIFTGRWRGQAMAYEPLAIPLADALSTDDELAMARADFGFGEVIGLDAPLQLQHLLAGGLVLAKEDAGMTAEDGTIAQEETELTPMIVRAMVSTSPELPPIGMGLLIFALAILAIAIGPGQRFLLARIGRPRWIWITTPIMLALFTFVMVQLAYARMGKELRTQSVAMISWAPASGYVGEERFTSHFPGGSGRYQMHMRGEHTAITAGVLNLSYYSTQYAGNTDSELLGRADHRIRRSEEGTLLSGRHLRLGAMSTVAISMGHDPAPLAGLSCELTEEAGIIKIVNRGNRSWQVHRRGQAPAIASLVPGGEVTIDTRGDFEELLPTLSWPALEQLLQSNRSELDYFPWGYNLQCDFTFENATNLARLALGDYGLPARTSGRIHGWAGDHLCERGRRLITLVSADAPPDESPIKSDDPHIEEVFTIVRLLVPESAK